MLISMCQKLVPITPSPLPLHGLKSLLPQSPSQLDDKGYFHFSNNIHLELPSLLLQVSRGVLKEFTRM